jgi:hypothetical protein
MGPSSPKLLLLAVASFAFAACSDTSRAVGGGGGGGGGGSRDAGTNMPATGASCGNGVVEGLEACDGALFRAESSCQAYGLGSGRLGCTNTCVLDTSSCSVRDYCTANNLYGNGECDACDLLGGIVDPDCMQVCTSSNAVCADRYDPLTGTYTCKRLRLTDPDCGRCGNNVRDGNELCDGRAFAQGQFTCESYGFLGGELGCRSDCLPDFASCRTSRCGDGVVEGTERCDGTNFGSEPATCEARGFAGGMLTCTSSCTVTERACVAPGCGNGILERNAGETCEGQNLDGKSCTSEGFAGGDLACDATCRLDATRCVRAGCGNGIRESGEECETNDLVGATCQSRGFLQGNLACSSSSCTFDTSGCVAPGCGNGILEASEQCEGQNLANQSCTSIGLGFTAGDLRCGNDCRFDTSGCRQAQCGDEVREGAEECDGSDLGGNACNTRGFQSGSLGCTAGCRFDTSQCNGVGAVCGDGRIQGLEACDGSDFGQNSRDCSTYGLGTGQVRCSSRCAWDFSGCSMSNVCDTLMAYSDMACDACQLYSAASMPDTACASQCGRNNACADYFDTLLGEFSCFATRGARDPDCGCGDGFLEPPQNNVYIELCEGTQFNVSTDCAQYGFRSGTVRCNARCGLDFAGCN